MNTLSLSTKNAFKLQIESKKHIFLLYCILGTGIFVVHHFTVAEVGPASIIFFLALILAFDFYFQINKIITYPSTSILTSLKHIMYIFIVFFVIALAIDFYWWNFLTITSFLGITLAIAGYFIMKQVIASIAILVPSQQTSLTYNRQQYSTNNITSKYCPKCGTSLVITLASNFCPKCGKKV